MSNHINLAAALALSVATFAQANAGQVTEATTGFYLPAVVGAAYTDVAIATGAAEARRQGGFATAGAVQWLAAAPAQEIVHFNLPGVVGAAYGERGVATNPVEVRQQGGFGAAGTIRWLPSAPVETSKVAHTAQAPLQRAHQSAID